MKTRFSSHYRFMFLATLAAVCACAPVLRAEWGSLRANNRRGRGPEIERGHPEVARAEERRRLDIEAERRHAFYWAGFRPGLAMRVLPVGYVQVSLGGVGFYYYDGVYFQPTTTGAYAVVAPPVGVIVPQLPDGAEAIVMGPTTYYFVGGAFYLQQPTGFAVVPAPLGVTVTGLPPGATPVTLNGAIYYTTGSAYFRPVMQAGVTVYVTARP